MPPDAARCSMTLPNSSPTSKRPVRFAHSRASGVSVDALGFEGLDVLLPDGLELRNLGIALNYPGFEVRRVGPELGGVVDNVLESDSLNGESLACEQV